MSALAIADLAVGRGVLGFSPCPGRCEPNGKARRLDLDLAAIGSWGAGLVVTLAEAEELALLGVPDLGQRITALGIGWRHLPIRDFGVPDAAFLAEWPALRDDILTRLDRGARVLLHCRGGLGRSGLVAALMLTATGLPADQAIAHVRKARPGAIETAAQEAFLHQHAALAR